MKLSNEELNRIMMKADNDLDMLKDRCHDLYDENEELKKKCNMYEMNMYREENEKIKYKKRIEETLNYLDMVEYFAKEDGRIILSVNDLRKLLEGRNK